jgi:hypothetical protein
MFKSTLRNIKLFLILLIASACSDSTTGVEDEPVSEIEIQTVENLHAPADRSNPDAFPYVYFNIRTGETVDAVQAETENWDIAFRGSSVIVNSGTSGPGQAGAILLDIEFEKVEIAPSDGYRQDSEEEPAITGNGGWYTYTGNGNPPFAVITHDDTTIILKTADGNHFAKLHIMSYYKDNPNYDSEEFANLQTRPASQYYTFRYAIQMTEGLRDLK